MTDLSEFHEKLKEELHEKLAFIAANREKLVEAWLAETGLKPSESILYQQEMGDGRTRMWIEPKGDECLPQEST